jgi:predicted MPP superfamily phosphohydrolase
MNKLLSGGFTLLIFGLLALSVWYVSNRMRVYFGLRSFGLIIMSVAAVVIGALLAIVVSAKSSNPFVGVLSVFGGYALMFYIYVLFLFILIHVLSVKWNLPLVWCAAAALVLALAMTGAGALGASAFAVNETEIRIPGLQKEVAVMHISDVHLGWHRGREYLEKIVNETNRMEPDIILITGDMADSEVALTPETFEPLAGFAAPVCFVGGNHEKYIGAKQVFGLIEQYGVRVFHNEAVYVHGLQIVGLDYMSADETTFDMHPSDDARTIKSTLESLTLKPDMPTLLMHHSPVGAKYAEAKGVDLMLSGHTHAGQVFPFTLLGGILFPFNRGLYREGKLQVFVTQGAGTYMLRSRLGSSNEISMLRLMPGN